MSLSWLPKEICRLDDISKEELYPYWEYLQTMHKIVSEDPLWRLPDLLNSSFIRFLVDSTFSRENKELSNASIKILVDLIRLFCPNSLPLKQKAVAFVFNALVDFDSPICAIEGIRGIGVLIESIPRFIPGVIQIGFFERLARRIEKEMKRTHYFEEEIRLQQRRRGRSPPPDQSSFSSRSFKCSSKSRSPPPKISLIASATSPHASLLTSPPVSPSASASASVMVSSGNPQEKSSKQQKAQKVDSSSITQKKPEETGQKGKSQENTSNAVKDEKKEHSVSPPSAQQKQKQNKENGKGKGKDDKTSKSQSPPPVASNKRGVSLSPPPSAKTSSSSSSAKRTASKSPPPKCAGSASASASASVSSASSLNNEKDLQKTSSQNSSKQKTESKAFSLFESSSSSSSFSASDKKIERQKRNEEEEDDDYNEEEEDKDEDNEEEEEEEEKEEEEEESDVMDDNDFYEDNSQIAKAILADKFEFNDPVTLKRKRKRKRRNKEKIDNNHDGSKKKIEAFIQDTMKEEEEKEKEWKKNYAQFYLFCEACLNTIERFLPEDEVGLDEGDEKNEKQTKESEAKEETKLKEEEAKEKKGQTVETLNDQTEKKYKDKDKERELKEKLEKEKEIFNEKQKYKKEIDVNVFKCLQAFLGFALTMKNEEIRRKAQKIIDWIAVCSQNNEMDKKAGKENKTKEKEEEVKKSLPKSLKESWSLSEEVTNAVLLLSDPQTAQSGLNLLLWLFRHARSMYAHQAICSFLFHSPFLSIIFRIIKQRLSKPSKALLPSSCFLNDLLRVLWWFARVRKEAALKVARMGITSELVLAIPQVAEELIMPCLAVVAECVCWREAFWIVQLTSPLIGTLINLCTLHSYSLSSSSPVTTKEITKTEPYLIPSIYLLMHYASEPIMFWNMFNDIYVRAFEDKNNYRVLQKFDNHPKYFGSFLRKFAASAVDDSVADAAGVLSLLLYRRHPFEWTEQEMQERRKAEMKERKMKDCDHYCKSYHFSNWGHFISSAPKGTEPPVLIYPSETHPIVQSCISMLFDDDADVWKIAFKQKLEELKEKDTESNEEVSSSSSASAIDSEEDWSEYDVKENNSVIFEDLKNEMRRIEGLKREADISIPQTSANQSYLRRDQFSSVQAGSSSNGDQKIKQGSALFKEVGASSECGEEDEEKAYMENIINSVELSIPVDPLVKVESGLTAMSIFAGQSGIDFRMRPLYSRATFIRALELSSFPHPRIILSALYAMDSFTFSAFGFRAAGVDNMRLAARRVVEIITEIFNYQQKMKKTSTTFEGGTYYLKEDDTMPSSVPSCSIFPSCYAFAGCENEILYAAFRLLLHIQSTEARDESFIPDKTIFQTCIELLFGQSDVAGCFISNEVHSPLLYVPLTSFDSLPTYSLPQQISDCLWVHSNINDQQIDYPYKYEDGNRDQIMLSQFLILFLEDATRSPQLSKVLYSIGFDKKALQGLKNRWYSKKFYHH
ncbi:uncharacterized protein MONOS_1308 [Monocercomonoides exilis]|uniref:uncharacterized protein n=1 Tax=Monocercomonoides exilis TaxID=2049356 RepID=UPI00355A779B|nr:hypothetical protein MONOS_1308 [Monocercomonoides exilis]|eukprot:MONOS_1308.1-p1 / transcript=MONOS_1308.1 / gene=MONOS_1308 / organism=Monocercomonoides_exilis_PA203 / gene_product=unspecified product / transcript_product=unspecified product / location=Mono_scaffold00022:148229-153068(-) / protein_length=1469 / sequence_SO=supercontig / SO=protein_coding / is_pseudo=false